MNFLAHFICQGTEVLDLDVGKIRKSMLLNWEQQSGGKPPRPQQAQKISAVKRGPNEPPFQQQQQPQQQQQEGSGRGRRNRRGNRAGRGRDPQVQPLQPEEEPAPSPGPSPPFVFGHIASPVYTPPPSIPSLPPWYPPPKPTSHLSILFGGSQSGKKAWSCPNSRDRKTSQDP